LTFKEPGEVRYPRTKGGGSVLSVVKQIVTAREDVAERERERERE
jgi:hypothetical protein